ncbi:hypothetical protein MSAN_00176400 [Mycena sanguinolenta]|uniref:Uncharacterized protein n=1 Tax=Mycena sanguinolenta TaxID=230812 RepID=A0A8H6ZJJ3_9AGAR|nr:hypothetical protein MSAN_00176400 [Mycena sanguinolenta]
MTSELDHTLLAELDARFCVNATVATALLPQFGHGRTGGDTMRHSKVAYAAYKTLATLATAESALLWRHFGDILAQWPGAASRNFEEAYQQERAWVDSFREEGPAEADALIMEVRKVIASVELQYVTVESFPAFIDFTSANDDERLGLDSALCIHPRSQQSIDTIFVFPFLPQLEDYIKDGIMSSPHSASFLNVIIVATAKAIIHETRHMLGRLIHGIQYCTPPMVQGLLAPPLPSTHAEQLPANAVQGEAGEWHEISRYGTVLSPALVSPTEVVSLETVTLHLIGHLNGDTSPRYLLYSRVNEMAERVLDGTFVELSSPFFGINTTRRVTGYVVSLKDLEEADTGLTPQPRQPPCSLQTNHWCSLTAAKPSGPYPIRFSEDDESRKAKRTPLR